MKKVVEIHKTNEDLQQQLFDKVEQFKVLEEKLRISDKQYLSMLTLKEEVETDFKKYIQDYQIL